MTSNVSLKSVDGSQNELWSGRPTKANEVIGVAPVRNGTGLGPA